MTSFRECDIENALKIARYQRNDIILCCSNYQKGSRILARVIGFKNGNVKLIVKEQSSVKALEKLFVNTKVIGYSQESNFKFKTEVKEFYKNRLTIEMPKVVEFLHKRKHNRIEAPLGYQVRCAKNCVELNVYDISSGGISLLLDHLELGIFNKLDESFSLNLVEEEFQAILQGRLVSIRGLSEERQGKSHRASFEFKNLTSEGHEMVSKLVRRFDNEVQRVS